MTNMAERPSGGLDDYAPRDLFDHGLDTAPEPDPDATGAEGWTAAHFSEGGGEATDDTGDTVILDADGSVSTFLAGETGVGSADVAGWAAAGDRAFGYDPGADPDDED